MLLPKYIMDRPSSVRPSIFLFGDSITQQCFSPEHRGWGAYLSDWYFRRADVLNRGHSGYNSRWGAALIKKLMPDKVNDILFATIFFGANDAVNAGEKQHVPLEEYRCNLMFIVEHIRKSAGATVPIILVTPPVVDAEKWPSRSIENASCYAAVVRAVAADMNTYLIDFWDPSTIWKIDLSDLRDGLHFGESGNLKMVKGLEDVIRQNRYLCPSDVEMHFPDHKILGDAKYLAEDSGAIDYYENIISTWEWGQ